MAKANKKRNRIKHTTPRSSTAVSYKKPKGKKIKV
jgi:hypothetical protein